MLYIINYKLDIFFSPVLFIIIYQYKYAKQICRVEVFQNKTIEYPIFTIIKMNEKITLASEKPIDSNVSKRLNCIIYLHIINN